MWASMSVCYTNVSECLDLQLFVHVKRYQQKLMIDIQLAHKRGNGKIYDARSERIECNSTKIKHI